jgi:hypothetical protein
MATTYPVRRAALTTTHLARLPGLTRSAAFISRKQYTPHESRAQSWPEPYI